MINDAKYNDAIRKMQNTQYVREWYLMSKLCQRATSKRVRRLFARWARQARRRAIRAGQL